MDDAIFQQALRKRLQAEYLRGVNDGLESARKIRGWLTRQPDRKWQAQVREWVDAEIAAMEASIKGVSNAGSD